MFRREVPQEKDLPQSVTHTDSGDDRLPPMVTSGADSPEELRERDPKRYEVIAEHGRGGLGRVMRARDTHLGRDVAIKEILHRGGASEARFVREAMITARLEHPGIVPVHDAGRWPDGTPFYAMKLVAGLPLKELIDKATSLHERLSLLPHVVAVADAIAYAHSLRVLHRDLKPSNVIVGSYGETLVIDWGLAKDLDEEDQKAALTDPYRSAPDDNLTAAGTILGTPAYMAPEQARGETATTLADVYALGAILFHILSGKAPFSGHSTPEILRRLSERSSGRASPAFGSPPKVLAQVPDLMAIAAKAMASAPEQRYPTVLAFSLDLRRFVDGRLVSAYQYSILRVIKKWSLRNKSLVGLALISAFALATLSVLAVQRIRRERDRAFAAEQRAREERDEVILTQAATSMRTDPTATIAWLKLLPPEVASRDSAKYFAHDAISRNVASNVLAMSPKGLSQIARSSDGSTVAVSDVRGDVRILDGRTFKERSRMSGSGPAPLLVTADGSEIVTADYKGNIQVQRRRKAQHMVPAHTKVPYLGHILTTGKVVTAGLGGDVRLTNVEDGSSTVLIDHGATVRALDISPGRTHVISGSDSGAIFVTEVSAQRSVRFRSQSNAAVYDLDYVDDGHFLSLQSDGIITYWNATGGELRTVTVAKEDADHLRVSSDGSYAFVCGSDGKVVRLDLSTFNITTLIGSGVTMTNSVLAKTPYGDFLAVSYADGSIRYWFTESLSSGILRGHVASVSSLTAAPSKDGVSVLSVDLAGILRVWDISPPPTRLLATKESAVLALAWSDERQLLAMAGHDTTIGIVDLTGEVNEWRAHDDSIQWMAWLEQGDLLVSVGVDGIVRVWESVTWSRVAEFYLPGRLVSASVGDDDTIDFVIGRRVYRWRPLAPDISLVLDAPEDLQATLSETSQGLAVLTAGMQIALVSTSGAFRALEAHIHSVLGPAQVLVTMSTPGTRSFLYRVADLPDLTPRMIVATYHDVAASMYDPVTGELFLLSSAGVGTAVSHGMASTTLHSTRATLDLIPVGPRQLMRLTRDACVEYWDFAARAIVVTQLSLEGTISAREFIPGREQVLLGTRKGQVWLVDLGTIRESSARKEGSNLHLVTDYVVGGEAFSRSHGR